MLNIVCAEPMWRRFRRVGRNANAMVIRGRVEHHEGVTNLVADHLEPLSTAVPRTTGQLPTRHASRDFR